jgi:serine-type D-Ala-D-Ala carboxypeptidase (penicillin-binding protein 5/6)
MKLKKNDFKKAVSNKITILVILGILIVCGSFIYLGWQENKEEQRMNEELSKIPAPPVDYFKNINIEAKSAIVYDVANKEILYQKNADDVRPLASITKIMAAYAATDLISHNEIIEVNEESLKTEGESGLVSNQKWRFKDLLNFTLFVSSNDGASAIAYVSEANKGQNLIDEMNKKAAELNLQTLKFKNATGLDLEDANSSGGYGSAKDVAALFSILIQKDPGLLEVTRNDYYAFKDLENTRYVEENTDIVVNRIPGVLASKTGYTSMAGGNLAIAMDAGLNRPIVIVVLGSSQEGRFKDILSLADTTRKAL